MTGPYSVRVGDPANVAYVEVGTSEPSICAYVIVGPGVGDSQLAQPLPQEEADGPFWSFAGDTSRYPVVLPPSNEFAAQQASLLIVDVVYPGGPGQPVLTLKRASETC